MSTRLMGLSEIRLRINQESTDSCKLLLVKIQGLRREFAILVKQTGKFASEQRLAVRGQITQLEVELAELQGVQAAVARVDRSAPVSRSWV